MRCDCCNDDDGKISKEEREKSVVDSMRQPPPDSQEILTRLGFKSTESISEEIRSRALTCSQSLVPLEIHKVIIIFTNYCIYTEHLPISTIDVGG